MPSISETFLPSESTTTRAIGPVSIGNAERTTSPPWVSVGSGSSASAWVGPVRDRAVADRGHTDRLFVVAELVDDAIRANPQRAKTSQPTTQLVPGMGLSFQQTKCIFDGVDQRPAEIE
jgi:hypothetical protein